MISLLRQYIAIIVETHLINSCLDQTKSSFKKDDVSDYEKIDEFSGVGAIAGFVAPLGYSNKNIKEPIIKKNKRKKLNRI